MNTFVATDTLQKIILLFLLGKSAFLSSCEAKCDDILGRTCKIGNNTLIGSSTHIHDNVEITESVIGQNCVIGAGTVIRRSYIFDGTIIGSQCVIEQSIIGTKVNIKNGTQVHKGSLIGDGVIVGPSAILGPFERLSKRRDVSDVNLDDEDEEVDSDLEDVEASAFWKDSLYLCLIRICLQIRIQRLKPLERIRTLSFGQKVRPTTLKRTSWITIKMNVFCG